MKARECIKNGVTKWLAEKTVAGKRTRKFFPTRAKAEGYILREKSKGRKLGLQRAALLTDATMDEAARCIQKLAPYGATLTQAVAAFAEMREAEGASKVLEELAAEFLAAKRRDGKSVRYLGELDGRIGALLAGLGRETKAAAVTVRAADAWLAGMVAAPQTRNHCRRVGHTFFQWCLKRGYTPANPFALVERAKVVRVLPGILTPPQLASLLLAARAKKTKSQPYLIAWLALGGFAGLRPAEIVRLRWEQIHFQSRTIDLAATGTKAARRRLVEMHAALVAWLEPIRLLAGPVVPPTFEASKALKKLRADAGFEWPHDALRHSFATYHLAAFEDAGRTALQLGHGGNPAMLFAHYRRPGITKETALQWWDMAPAGAAKTGKESQKQAGNER